MAATSTSQYKDTDIVITRDFAAPRQLVWDVWTQPAHIEKWFGPKEWNTKVESLDFRVGGRWWYVMSGPGGNEHRFGGMFKEIVPIEKVVSTDEFGEGIEESMKGIDLPKGVVVTTLFDDLGERTRLTLITSHPTLEEKQKHADMGVVDGWNSTFEKMEEYLAKVQG